MSLDSNNKKMLYTSKYADRRHLENSLQQHSLIFPALVRTCGRGHPDRTRIYDQELKKARARDHAIRSAHRTGATGQANQKQLSAGFAMDSTTLNTDVGAVAEAGLVHVRLGKDRRERLFSLTRAGTRQMVEAKPYWELAEHRLRQELGDAGWKTMKETVSRITEAAMEA